MLEVRRLKAVGVILALAAILTSSHVWGDPRPAKDKDLKDFHAGKAAAVDKLAKTGPDDQGFNRFGDQPIGLYETTAGDTLFWWQIKPALQDTPPRPRDVLVLVDTSASKAQGPLAQAQQIVKALIEKLGPDDKLALWTLNTRARDLSKGFKSAKGLENALMELNREYPSGAANLKGGLDDALKSFAEQPGRQRLILLLGSGTSIAGPVDDEARTALCADMIKRQVAFFAVPLGSRLDPLNLHGFVNGTGGKVVRFDPRQGAGPVVSGLLEAFAAPILYPAKVQLPDAVLEALPAELPPLRRDAGTLMVGKIKPGTARFEARVAGTLAGQEVQIKIEHPMPKPEIDNFFLSNIVKQWREQKDRPALMQADRALAFASDQIQMARVDLLAKAEMALDENKLDPAWKLFKKAEQLDPHSGEARAGLELVQKLRDGKVKRQDLKLQFDRKGSDMLARVENGQVVRRSRDDLLVQAVGGNNAAQPGRGQGAAAGQNDQGPPGVINAPNPNPADVANPNDALRDVQARQAVADQQARQLVDDAIRRGNRMVQTSPDDAHDYLKRTLEGIRNNPDITDRAKVGMSLRLEQTLQGIDRLGARIKRDQAERLALEAVRRSTEVRETLERNQQERIRERLRVFHNLMDQGRQDLAYQQAEAIRIDLVNQGKEVPQAVTAAYQMGLIAYHVREIDDLRRRREERWLAVLLSVEKSHMPFSDEPPVHYPDSATIKVMTHGAFDNWGDFSKYREARYSSQSFGAEMPRRALELRDALSKVVNFGGFDDPKTTLAEAIDQLQKRYDLTIEVNEKAFKAEGVMDVLKTEIAQPNPIPPVRASLGSVLKKILSRITTTSGATFMIRREAIEITTGQYALGEKTVRVYPVSELVIPIPSPQQFTQQQFLNQNGALGGASIFGGPLGALGALGALGGQLGALGALGGALGPLGGGLGALGGGLGALGGGLGALGGGLGALGGGLGALGGGLGALGGAGIVGGQGFAGAGGQGGFQGNFIGGGGVQGGGVAGFQGGFGLQNGVQQQGMALAQLVKSVVGRPKDWAPQFNPVTGEPLNPLDMGQPGGMDVSVLGGDDNQVVFYQPSMALVVKGTSRITTRSESPLFSNVPGMGAGGMGMRDKMIDKIVQDALAKNDKKAPNGKVAGNGNERDPKNPPLDPKEIWQDCLAKGVDNPGLIVAVADYLALNLKWDHAAEFLKANLRQGVVVKPWVYEALAIALRESGGSPDEIERAEVSSAELLPGDVNGYLKAATAMAGHMRYDRAVAFCKQAAALEPGLGRPYAEALLYAELGQDSQAMTWAAGNLLRQDWPFQNKELQGKALLKLESLARTLEKSNRQDQAQKLLTTVHGQRQRDLVIKLEWQGEADLDLKVTEPCGSVCSALSRQTVGGGTLIGDSLADMTSETYLAAQAFAGEYQIRVDRVWGKPLGGKALLKIIRHQGTSEQFEELVTVDVLSGRPVKITLDKGRRVETAFVPPPAAVQASDGPTAVTPESPDRMLNHLRAMADPEITGYERGFSGSTSSSGIPMAATQSLRTAEKSAGDRTLMQNRVSSFVQNSMDVTAQAVLSADRRTVRVSLSPVYSTVTPAAPVVSNPLIPGGR